MIMWTSKKYIVPIAPDLKLAFKVGRKNIMKRSRKSRRIVLPVYSSSIRAQDYQSQFDNAMAILKTDKIVKSKTAKTKKPNSTSKAARTTKQPTASRMRKVPAFLAPVIILVGAVGALLFTAHMENMKTIEPSKTFSNAAATPAAKPQAPAQQFLPKSVPTHITVASVGIDADIVPVGQDANGSIEMPPLFDWVTGWYNLSPTPGEKGPAIIVGHVDNYKGISVFWHLRDVQPGAIVNVSRTDGSTVKFKVDSLQQFDKSAFPTQEVYGNIDHAGLRLITCGGAFDSSTKDYTQNTVVFASMVK
jgi:hypothetical protein